MKVPPCLQKRFFFNRIPLCYDPDPSFKFLYYRELLTDFITDTPEKLMGLIHKTLDHPVVFEKEKFNKLIYKEREHPWTIIKRDIKI